MADDSVPWQTAPAIAAAVNAEDVVVTLIKNGDHRLSEPDDIARLCAAVTELSDR